MGEAAAEGVLHRRIEFHAERRPHAAAVAVAGGGWGFRMETLNTDAGMGAAAASGGIEGEGRRSEKGEVGGSWGVLDPELSAARIYFRKIGAGLQNLGNTCYLNSVLQCLTYTEPFVAYLQSGKHKSSCRTAGFCALCALQNHVRSALQSTGKILTPVLFVKNIRCISRSFHNSTQEDAHELMVNLLESMHKCCLPSGVQSESPSAYEKSLVHKIFGGCLRSQVRCTRCSHCSNKFDPFLDLSLEIDNATTLVRALKNFTEEELLDGGEKQYHCQRCRQKVVAKKRFTIDKAPYVLTIHLKRFDPFNPPKKIDTMVDFRPTLDLRPFVSNSEGTDLKYSLYGVLVHDGHNTQSGHYYCFVRTSSGMWHNLDDNQVHQVRETDVLGQKAYMLFYVRDRLRSSVMRKDHSAANVSERNMISQKITCLNGAIQNGLAEKTLNGSFIYGDVKMQKQNMDNGQSSIINRTSQDIYSKNDSNTGVIEAAASQNNCPTSVWKAPCIHPDNATTLCYKSNQITYDSKTELTSFGQPDAIILDVSGAQKAVGVLVQPLQLEADAAFANSGKDTPVAFPVSHGAGGLSEADDRALQPQIYHFCEPTSKVNDTVVTAQVIPTKDATVSNGIISGSGGSTSGEAKGLESLKQHDEVLSDKKISVKIANADEQTPMQNNITPKVGQVSSEKQICSEYSVEEAQEVLVADPGQGNLPKKIDVKLKKPVKYPIMSLCFGPKQLLLNSLKLCKKKRHKRTKRQLTLCQDLANTAHLDNTTNDQQASTSETALTKNAECKSRRRKRSHVTASSQDGGQMFINVEHLVEASCTGAVDHMLNKKESKNRILAGAELPSLCPSSAANQTDSRNRADANERHPWHVNLLTRGLREITVPQWDDIDMPNTIKAAELQYSRSKSIGYVLDEWDEYDREKRKKVKKSKEEFGGLNPFHETAGI